MHTSLDRFINIFLYFAYREPNHTIDTQKAYYLIYLADRKQIRYSAQLMIDTDYYYINGYHIIPAVINKTPELSLISDKIIRHNGTYEVLTDYDYMLTSETTRRILEETYEYFKDWNTDKLWRYAKKLPEYREFGILDKHLFFKENRKGFFKDDQKALKATYDYFCEIF